jgi:hypothetical protein
MIAWGNTSHFAVTCGILEKFYKYYILEAVIFQPASSKKMIFPIASAKVKV